MVIVEQKVLLIVDKYEEIIKRRRLPIKAKDLSCLDNGANFVN